MATKTISVKLEAYERLKQARRAPDESFSQVIMRAEWPEQTINGQGLLQRYQQRGPWLTSSELDDIQELKHSDRPPNDKHPKQEQTW